MTKATNTKYTMPATVHKIPVNIALQASNDLATSEIWYMKNTNDNIYKDCMQLLPILCILNSTAIHNQQFSKHTNCTTGGGRFTILTNVGSNYYHRPPVMISYKTKEIIFSYTSEIKFMQLNHEFC